MPPQSQRELLVQKMVAEGTSDDDIRATLKAFDASQQSKPSDSWVTRHPVAAEATRQALNALPAVGAMVGGIAATPETAGAGTAVGMGLGAAAGRGVRDLAAEQLGLQDPSSYGSEAARMGTDAALTAATQAALPGVIEAIKTPVQTAREFASFMGKFVPKALQPQLLEHFINAVEQSGANEAASAATTLTRPAWQSRAPIAPEGARLVKNPSNPFVQALNEIRQADTANAPPLRVGMHGPTGPPDLSGLPQNVGGPARAVATRAINVSPQVSAQGMTATLPDRYGMTAIQSAELAPLYPQTNWTSAQPDSSAIEYLKNAVKNGATVSAAAMKLADGNMTKYAMLINAWAKAAK